MQDCDSRASTGEPEKAKGKRMPANPEQCYESDPFLFYVAILAGAANIEPILKGPWSHLTYVQPAVTSPKSLYKGQIHLTQDIFVMAK